MSQEISNSGPSDSSDATIKTEFSLDVAAIFLRIIRRYPSIYLEKGKSKLVWRQVFECLVAEDLNIRIEGIDTCKQLWRNLKQQASDAVSKTKVVAFIDSKMETLFDLYVKSNFTLDVYRDQWHSEHMKFFLPESAKAIYQSEIERHVDSPTQDDAISSSTSNEVEGSMREEQATAGNNSSTRLSAFEVLQRHFGPINHEAFKLLQEFGFETLHALAKVDEKTVQTIKRQIREEKTVNALEVISSYPCKRLKCGHELGILSIGELARKINSAPVVQPSILRMQRKRASNSTPGSKDKRQKP